MELDYSEGATPLDPDEAEGLRLTHITTRRELDTWEQRNIDRAVVWAFGGRKRDILNESFIRQLHKRMLGDVWSWAGNFRKTDKNIGVPKERIGVDLRELCDDVKFWIEHHTFEPDEIATRFHHRLVFVHPFPNGNGRHARLITDLLLQKELGLTHFSWGGGSLNGGGECRGRYITALRAADRGDYALLTSFVRS